jgi:hypothetical protein
MVWQLIGWVLYFMGFLTIFGCYHNGRLLRLAGITPHQNFIHTAKATQANTVIIQTAVSNTGGLYLSHQRLLLS